MKKKRFSGWWFLGGGTWLVALGAYVAGLRVNVSESMPRGLYRLSRCGTAVSDNLAVGDVVAIDIERASQDNSAFRVFAEAQYFSVTGTGRDVLLKRVAAKGGDRVEVRAGRVRINERTLGEEASTRVSYFMGRTFIPSAEMPLIVPEDHIWLTCDHERGIDSRYFGPVRADAIRCVAEPLWIF